MSLDTTIFQILKAIDVAFENDNFDFSNTLDLSKLNISRRRLVLLLEQLKLNGYITGILIPLNFNDEVTFHNIRLTLKGLDYLENNSSMKKAYKLLKEIKGWIPSL
ncbi:YjcQ family protein [Leptotrichia trevisanii]|uniref:YjcQ family protein n=1 Tax=Leptotrichia trevisanii TaxID=109328 RepID=UPI000688B878|nr:YjcQ family protein [Leptotrichia trevisanii]